MGKIKVVDLFSGVGGLSYGFANDSDFNIIAANEISEDAAKAYSLNHPNIKMYCKDIKLFGLKDLTRDFDLKKGAVDLVIGGSPCQAYSTVGKRLLDDPKGFLFQEYYRVLKEVEPRAFIFENVKGLLSMQKGALFFQILSVFGSLGYSIKFKILNSANYGIPQIRERVIVIGVKKENNFSFPLATHSNDKEGAFKDLPRFLTLGEAISDLPFIKSNEEGFLYRSEPKNDFQKLMRERAPKIILDHNAPNNNAKLIQLMELLPEGGSPKDLPEGLRPKSGFGNTYCRLWWDRPSPTITRNFSTPSSSRCIHPKVARPLTTREGARLQGFPDDYIFYGSRSSKNLQIGNAVSTFLSIALKESVKKIF